MGCLFLCPAHPIEKYPRPLGADQSLNNSLVLPNGPHRWKGHVEHSHVPESVVKPCTYMMVCVLNYRRRRWWWLVQNLRLLTIVRNWAFSCGNGLSFSLVSPSCCWVVGRWAVLGLKWFPDRDASVLGRLWLFMKLFHRLGVRSVVARDSANSPANPYSFLIPPLCVPSRILMSEAA